MPAIHFDQTFDLRFMSTGRFRKLIHIVQRIDTNDGACTQLGQTGEPVDFVRVAHLDWRQARL